jgi:hypothetical protein
MLVTCAVYSIDLSRIEAAYGLVIGYAYGHGSNHL